MEKKNLFNKLNDYLNTLAMGVLYAIICVGAVFDLRL